ncbi:MAG: hypothetical protein ACK56I_06005, partial [bacterium]
HHGTSGIRRPPRIPRRSNTGCAKAVTNPSLVYPPCTGRPVRTSDGAAHGCDDDAADFWQQIGP